MEIKEFITNLSRSNFSLSVDDGKLNLTGDKNKLSKAEIDGIKSNKEVIDYIRANKNEIIEHLTLYSDLSSVKKSKDISSVYRLSGLQQGMLFHSLYDGETAAYKVQFKCELSRLNEKAFSESWRFLLRKHTILRSAFYYDAFNVPVQCVYNTADLPIEILDLRSMNAEEKKATVLEYEVADMKKAFDLKKPPLMRVGLLRLSDDLYRMQWTSHHILFDGWSLPVLMEEFLSTYELLISGKEIPAIIEDKYEDYIRYIERTDKVKQEAYWRSYLKEVEQSTLLPFIETTAERTKGAGSFQSAAVVIDAATTLKIQNFAQENRVTVNTIFQGVWAYLLHRYTGSNHIVFGVVVSGRPEGLPGVEKRVGVFINTLPLHSILVNETLVIEWLNRLQTEQISSRQYQHTPLSDVQQWTGVQGDFFDSLLVFENYPVNKIVKSNQWSIGIENVHVQDSTSYPLTILVNNSAQLNIQFNYNEQLLSKEEVQTIGNHFEHVLVQMVENSHTTLSNIKLVVPAEEKSLLETFNATAVRYPTDKTIVDMFEGQVVSTPEKIAVVFEQQKLTYQQLNERANQLAHYLQSKGVTAETLIPICIERGAAMIIGMLGILKAGGAYVPIDPAYPQERINYMLQDTAASVIITSRQSRVKLSIPKHTDIIEIDSNEAIQHQPTDNLQTTIQPGNLAYIIYTSGSTGKPKGVMIEHRNLSAFINWSRDEFSQSHFEIAYASTSICFDLSVFEIFYPLTVGKPIRIVENGLAISQYLTQDAFVLINCVPSVMDYLLKNAADLRNVSIINMAGEPVSLHILQALNTDKIEVRNLYGPTEDTTYSTVYRLLKGKAILIGKPIANTQIYMLDNAGQLSPAGVFGELCISGDGLARGYLNQPQLTSDKFVKNPFGKEGNSKMYKTGDLARWLPDGNIEYGGRLDDQVKIRGYRIELGEIETILQQSGLLKEVVVLARERNTGNKRLVGYVVTEKQFDRETIIFYLKSRLPEFMLPGLWVVLDRLPLTPNGKIDRKALPDPDVSEMQRHEYVAPRNEMEEKLANIWKGLLGLEKIGIHDNFFDVGGHSLLAMRAVSSIRRLLEAELVVKDFFEYPTIAALSAYLQSQNTASLLPPIKAQLRPAHIPLSFSQERLWFIDQLEGSRQYHMPSVLRIKGNLNVDALRNALNAIVNRHEVLRSVILKKDGRPYQLPKEVNQWNLEHVDGSAYVERENDLKNFVQELIQKPFDLSADYMLRAHLITVGWQEYVVVITLHHIASDGWSRSILVKEIVELYASHKKGSVANLLPLPLQYADYAIWQRAYFQEDVLEKKMGYWKKQLDGTATLNLPTDFTRPAIQSTKGASISFKVSQNVSEKISELSKAQGTTLYMTLLAVFKILLYRYSGQNDICVGTGIAGRQQQETEGLIGFFVNTLAMRSQVYGDTSYLEFLQAVKATTLEAYHHQEVPFEQIVDAVVTERDLSRNPLLQVTFIVQNTPDIPQLVLDEVELSVVGFDHITSRFDISFSVKSTATGLEFLVEYCADLFYPETIKRMVGHYRQLLGAVLKNPDQNIDSLLLITTAEHHQITSFSNSGFTTQPSGETLVTLFEKQANETPDAVALVFKNQTFTYKVLNEKANQLAHFLSALGVEREMLIPICIERSPEMIVGILGILKAGGAYVPIDPSYPQDRIDFMLEDIGATLVVSSSNATEKLVEQSGIRILQLDGRDKGLIDTQPTTNLPVTISNNQLAYVIYTSGSTGKPKGVLIEHKSVANLIERQTEYFGIDSTERIIQFSNYCFDASVEQIFLALSNGASLILFEEGFQLNPEGFSTFLNDAGITHLHSTPFFLENLSPDKCGALRRVVAAGDLCRRELVNKWEGVANFYNKYGPTEAAISVAEYKVELNSLERSTSVPIGKPLPNVPIYVLDKNYAVCPVGIPGEIYISGIQVARGYLNQPELTLEKFIELPTSSFPPSRLYKTGDLGRWLADGNLEYLGRMDNQVKIHGYRIETGEIESVLNAMQLVDNSCVVVKEDKDIRNNRLVAYYLPNLSAVKLIEGQLYNEQVASWKEIHENEYTSANENGENPEFDILGWNDSFTRTPIPEEHMREWLADIVNVIFSDTVERVLEIGSGSGLIYYQLAGKVKKYIGTDFSKTSINLINNRVSLGLRDYGPTELQVAAAHEVTVKDTEAIDTIVLNSIIQYFPGEEYLSTVIANSISILKNKGRIIIGDVRDLRTLKLFKARLKLEQLPELVSLAEFDWALEQEILNEEELCFSPEYFYTLQTKYPAITHVEIIWKQGSFVNELTAYRYTVVIYVGVKKEVFTPDWQTWNATEGNAKMIAQLEQGIPVIAVKQVPNPRLRRETELFKALKNGSVKNVGELLEVPDSTDIVYEVNKIISTAIAKGYSYKLLIDEDPLKLNLLIELSPADRFIRHIYRENSTDAGSRQFTNIPLFNDICSRLQKDIRNRMVESLPEYMIPSKFVAIKKMPLNSNGKIDRKFLSVIENKDAGRRTDYQAPGNELEKAIAAIWKNLLNIEQVGINDNFFQLGGHSLMAVRVISSIRKELNVEVMIRDLFSYPTISELAHHLETLSTGSSMPSITVAPRPEHIPLSFNQEQLWFIDQLSGSLPYHIASVIKLEGYLNIEALKTTLHRIVERHQILRTVIKDFEGKPYQIVANVNTINLQLAVVDGSDYKNNENDLRSFIQSLINKPFNLSADILMRPALISLDENSYVLVITMHHIASDGWSGSILINEIVELYKSYIEKRPAELPSLPLQYADYAIWQQNWLQGETLHKKLDYWKEKLSGVEPLQLPTDFVRPSIQSTRGHSTSFNIGNDLVVRLRQLSNQEGVTLFITLLSAFKVLLYRYSGQLDICVGTGVSVREQQELERLIGFFVNTLALRTQFSGDDSFISLIQKVKSTTLEAFEHKSAPFAKVADAVTMERNRSRNAVFQVIFDLNNTPDNPEVNVGELQLSTLPLKHTLSKFDLTFFLSETPDGINGNIEYSTDLFTSSTIKRMAVHYKQLLLAIVNNPYQQIRAVPMITYTEEHQLLVEFNNINQGLNESRSNLIELFEKQAGKIPDETSVIYKQSQLSYQALNESANRLAHYLIKCGVKQETLVPVCIGQSLDMVIAILAILKTGAAYVPIDPEFPESRINYLLEDTAAKIVVSNKKNSNKLQGNIKLQIVETDTLAEEIQKQSHQKVPVHIEPHHLAYVIYTSGSTGKPKGVMISHAAILNYLLNEKANYISDTGNAGSFIHLSYTFDASLTAMFMPLIYGKSVVIGSGKSVSIFEDENCWKYAPYDFIKVTPAHLELLEASIADGSGNLLTQKLVVGGEALHYGQIKYFIEKRLDIEITNEYGPTEASVGCSTYVFNTLSDHQKIQNGISIGKPIGNVVMYILSADNALLPIGIAGEICIGGAGLASGYLNLSQLTAEKFVPNPFSTIAGAKMYKTGDMGRWLADGNIEYLSRKDDQVKIRGYRIELSEIEAVLRELETVRNAVVIANTDQQGTKRLIGYVVPNEGYDKQMALQHLKNTLPEYMVPAILMEIEALPLNANGKVDRKALPDPDESDIHTNEFVAPRNHNEQVLSSIWATLLDLDTVGVHDNFFKIGGDSLLAIRVASAIRKDLMVEMPISSLFEYQTIAMLAVQIEISTTTTVLPAILPVPRPNKIPLSFSQQRLWFIDKLEGTLAYHIPAVLRLKGQLNRQALQFALSTIINRHEVLRTIFPEQGGEPWQQVKEKGEWSLTVSDGSSFLQDTRALQQHIQQIISTLFDLSADTMLRADLITLTETENILIINLHHIASDGWSRSILVKEIAELYTAFEQGRQPALPPLPVQYADFSIWQQNYLQGELLDKKLNYWVNKLKGVAPLQMPADFVRPPIQTSRGSSAVFSFEKEITAALRHISQQYGSTLFMTLLTTLKILLHRYTGNTDVCVGTASAGRQQQELEGLIGFFINTLALRSAVQPDDSFVTLLKQIKQTTVEAFEHQDTPFEKIVDAITVKRDPSRNPVFQVMFVLHNTPEVPDIKLGNLTFSGENDVHNTAQFDLSFSITEQAGGLAGAVVYNADIYLPETINRLLAHFHQLVQSVVENPLTKISKLKIISSQEKQQLLVDFNKTTVAFPQNKTVVDLIEAQAELTPNHTALIEGQEAISYQELNLRSNQLAHHLKLRGVGAGKLVPVCMERSINLVISLLAILKTGAAYVPVDPDYPAERINYMLQDIGAGVLLSNVSGIAAITLIPHVEIIDVDIEWPTIAMQPSRNLTNKTSPPELVYIIYTSGSTGKPKGVMIEHANLTNLIYWHQKAYSVTSVSKTTAMAGVGFDAFGWEIWPYLTAGAAVHIISNEQRLSVAQLLQVFSTNGITHSFMPTALVPEFIHASGGAPLALQYLLTGGDKLPYVNTWDISYALINNYGPTESTVVATNYHVNQKDKAYPIGRPIANTSIYIIDKHNNLSGVGIPGEICIGGASLSCGYHNQRKLTAEKMIVNPFGTAGSRLYKTGDIGRWLSDGNIEYLGRMDEQVKIRGYRIELGEIETVLQQSGLVQQSVVVAKANTDGTKQLVGYVVANNGFNREAVLAYLKAMLPEYMVPTVWIKLESMPLTANGKVDKKALPDAGGPLSTPYAAPRNQTESALAEIWQQLLRTDKVGIHDNFFELGGHSLLAMRVIAAIHKQLKVELAVKDIFQADTISELSKYVAVQLSQQQTQNADEFDLMVI